MGVGGVGLLGIQVLTGQLGRRRRRGCRPSARSSSAMRYAALSAAWRALRPAEVPVVPLLPKPSRALGPPAAAAGRVVSASDQVRGAFGLVASRLSDPSGRLRAWR